MRRNLNKDISLGKIETCVCDLGNEDSVDFGVVFEILKDLNSLALTCWSINIGFMKSCGIMLQSIHII